MPSKRRTLVDKRARALCAKLAPLHDGRPMDYRQVRFMAQVLDYETADEAIVYAIQKGWLIVWANRHTAYASQTMAGWHLLRAAGDNRVSQRMGGELSATFLCRSALAKYAMRCT
jgi:hypothetical protein